MGKIQMCKVAFPSMMHSEINAGVRGEFPQEAHIGLEKFLLHVHAQLSFFP